MPRIRFVVCRVCFDTMMRMYQPTTFNDWTSDPKNRYDKLGIRSSDHMSSTGNLSRRGGLTLCILRSFLTHACCELKETSLSSKEDGVVWVVLRSAQYLSHDLGTVDGTGRHWRLKRQSLLYVAV